METIDPNAVIDAVARLFPDGIDCSEHGSGHAAEWHAEVAYDIGIYDDEGDYFDALDDAVGALMKAGRLRELGGAGGGWYMLSYAEQARRVVAMWYGRDFDPEQDALDIERIANVLAGKTEKKA